MNQTRRGRHYNKLYFDGANKLAGQATPRSSNLDLQLHCPKKQTHCIFNLYLLTKYGSKILKMAV